MFQRFRGQGIGLGGVELAMLRYAQRIGAASPYRVLDDSLASGQCSRIPFIWGFPLSSGCILGFPCVYKLLHLQGYEGAILTRRTLESVISDPSK